MNLEVFLLQTIHFGVVHFFEPAIKLGFEVTLMDSEEKRWKDIFGTGKKTLLIDSDNTNATKKWTLRLICVSDDDTQK